MTEERVPAVEMRGIDKRFAMVQALDKVNLRVEKGTIHALLGENGAGKSTLMKILYGLYAADSGEILINGQPAEIKSPKAAIDLSIGMVHQHFMLVQNFSIAENIVLGSEPVKGLGVLDRAAISQEISAFATKYGLDVDPEELIQDVSVATQQRVEILKALYRGAEILILDEPTAVLTPQEIDSLFKTLRSLKEEGKTIIIITHKLKEIKAVADYCTILRRGVFIDTVRVDSVTEAELAEKMVGREVKLSTEKAKIERGEALLKIRDLYVDDERKIEQVSGVSLDVHAGEIVALAGIDGNGQSELIDAITGLRKAKSGSISMAGVDIYNQPPAKVHQAGLKTIHEDRHRRGLVLDFTVAENTVLERYEEQEFSGQGIGVLNWANIRRYAQSLIKRFDIRPADAAAKKARQLSGGNQQKIIVAREVDQNPHLLIACQPTRGLDVGAIEFVRKELVAQRDAGKGIFLVSFELDEVLDLADRILVIYAGEIVAELDPKATTETEIGLYMSGAKRDSLSEEAYDA
ncbi:MAG: ABC transporter ATP-binding protein [Eubacteriales bacterium]|nr:ABC transporter ATP-binding protein [Eubacteriales bacterium]